MAQTKTKKKEKKYGIRKHGNLYQGAVYVGTDPGTKKKKYVPVSDSDERQCYIKCAELELKILKGQYVPIKKIKFIDYAESYKKKLHKKTAWAGVKKKGQIAPKTYRNYVDTIDNHMTPYLEHYILKDMRKKTIKKFYEDLLLDTSPYVVRYTHTLLNTMMQDAEDQELIDTNPCVALSRRLPAHEPDPRATWSLDQFNQAFDLLQREKSIKRGIPMTIREQLYVVAALAILAGLGEAEMCALEWPKISYEKCVIKIDKNATVVLGVRYDGSTKTKYRTRDQDFHPDLIPILKEHERRQKQQRLMLGGYWPGGNWVLRNSDGTPANPTNLSSTWRRTVQKYDIPYASLHRVRALYSTINMYLGTPEKIGAAMMGHKNPKINQEHYQTPLPDMKREAALRLGEAVGLRLKKNISAEK